MTKGVGHHKAFVYIDESGDDGIRKFRDYTKKIDGGGASHFLVLSALIVKASEEKNIPSWRNQIMNNVSQKRERQNLHFCDLRHEQKVSVANTLARLPVKAISVISNKKTIDASKGFNKKNTLYWYLCSHLLEMVSGYCYAENLYPLKIIFSRRGTMNYNEFVAHLEIFKGKQASSASNIYWQCFNPQEIEALDHRSSAGLQLVDVIATATARAVERDPYGNCEEKYFKTILPLFIRDKAGRFSDAGVKILPDLAKMSGYLSEGQREFFSWLMGG